MSWLLIKVAEWNLYIGLYSAQIPIAAKVIGRHLILRMDNDRKHIEFLQEFLQAKKWDILHWRQSPDTKPAEHGF